MKTSDTTIGIVLPAYNEGTVIGAVLDALPAAIKVNGKKYVVQPIVVNDGSKDDTSAVVASRPQAKLIDHVINSGAGAATRTGLHYAYDQGYVAAVTMDSDGQHATEDVVKLASAIVGDEADFIIGSRFVTQDGNMPTLKKIGNRGLGIVTYLLLGIYVSDSQSGLRAFSRKALGAIEYHSDDYAFCSEVIWKAHRAGLHISELPIAAIYTDYSLSRATGQKNFTGGINIVRQLLKRRLMDILHG